MSLKFLEREYCQKISQKQIFVWLFLGYYICAVLKQVLLTDSCRPDLVKLNKAQEISRA